MEVETDLNSITDEDQLRKMWLDAEDFNRKKEIRTHLYKLREARLRGFYDDVDTTSASKTTSTTITSRSKVRDQTDGDLSREPVNLSNITKNKFPFKSHGDSIIDHTYQSYKTKEIRDSESPTHETNSNSNCNSNYKSQNQQHVADNNMPSSLPPPTTMSTSDKSGWNIQTSSEISPDGKTHKNELYATTEGYKQLDDGHSEFSGVNTEKSTVAIESENDKTIKRAENESKIKLHEKKVTGDLDNQRTETETTEVFSTSSKTFTSTNKPSFNDNIENICSNVNVKSHNIEENVEKVESTQETSQMKKSREILKLDKSSPEYQKYVDYLANQNGQILSETSEYIKPNVKLVTTKKQLEDGTVVTTRRYETEEYETGKIDTRSSTKVETDKDIKKTYKVDNKNIKQPVKQQEDKNFIYEKNVDSAHNAFASSLRNQSQTPSPTASRRSSTRSNLSQSPPSRSSFRRRPSDDENSTFSRKNSTRSSFSTDKKDETSEIRKSSITKRITSKTDETSTDGAVYSRSNSAKLRKMSKDDVKDKDVYRRKDSHPKSPIQKRYFGDDKERRNSGTRSTITTKKESETKEVTSRYVRKPSSDSIRRSPSPELKRKPSTSSPETSRKPSSNICRSPSPDMSKKSRPLANGSIKTVRNIDESRTTITNIRRSPSPELIRKSSPSPDKKYSTVETKTTTKINKNPRDFPEGPEKYPRKYSEDKEETCIEINSGYPKTRPVTEPVEFRPSPGRTKPSDFRRSSNTSTTTVNIEESSTTEKTSKYIKSTDREEPKKPLKREPTPEISLKKLRKTSGPFSPDAEIEEVNYPTSKRTDTFIKEEQAREERDRRPVSPVMKRKPSELDSSTRRKSSSPDIPLTEAKKNLTERRDSLKKNQGDSRKSSVASTSPRRRSSGTIEVEDDKTKPSRKLKSVLKRSETYEERCRLILGMDNEEPTEKPDGSNVSKENKDVPANNEFIIDWNTEKDDSLKKKKVPLTDRKDSAPIQVTPKRTTSSIHRSTSEHVISKLEKKKSQEIILESNRLPDVIQEPEEENNRKNMKGKAIEIPILNEETNEYMKSFHIEELDETDEIPDRIGNTPSPIISSPQYPPQEDNDGKYIDDDNCLSVNEKLSKFLSMEKQNQLNVPVPAKGYKPHKHNKKYWENDGEDEVVIIETTPFTPDKENISQVKKQFENIDVNRKVDDKAKVNSNISRGIVSSRKDIFEIANSPVESNILRERDNISDEGKSKVSQLRHSYMNHTISSMEHRRDSLELAKTSYGQKIRASEEPYEPKSSTAVKFELGPKTPPKLISNTRKESRELLIPQPVDVDVLDSRKLEDVSVRRSSVDIEEYIPTKFGVELKRKNSQPKQRKSSNPEIPHIEEIFDLDLLEEMLKSATGYEQRRRIRAQIRIVKKKIEDRKVSGASPTRKMKSVTSTSTTTTKKVSSNDKGQDGFVRTSTVTTIKKQTGDKGEEKIVASTTTKRLTDQDVKTTTTKKRIEPTTTTKKTTTTTNDGPIWVRQNILRKVDSNERPVKTYKTTKTEVGPTKTVKTTTTTTTTSDGGQQKHTEVDVITSSYGIGPTDDDGKPLFGIRALKYKKSSELATENTTNNNTNDRSNCKSFINESSNELTSINDVITRMQNADKVQEDGDTEKDREARALLNKFIGANILMSSIETTTGSVPPLGPNKGNKNQINCSTTTRTTKASTTISGDNKSSIPDDSKLLEDEEPLEVINFLKQIMAGREDGAKPSGEEVDSTKKDAVKRETTSSSSTTTTAKPASSAAAGKKPISPLNKFKQLEKQNSLQSPKSPVSPQVAGGTGTPPQSPIFKFTDPALNARALTFKEQLLQWCQAKTKEYENVQITNFSTSWNDGLAFCALIHHFLPESFDYSKLDNKHRRQNFELAFRVADEKAGIAPLLDVEDMVVMKKPDWKCVFTYVQSIFRRFRNCQ